MTVDVTIDKLVHGGQGLGTLPDGRKAFVWNALPGETVGVEIRRNKKSWAEGYATEVHVMSPDRVEPKEAEFLATSPWQILDFAAENRYKADIVRELFDGEHIRLPDFHTFSDGREWQYRNKMEYSFFGDDDGLHLALHARGTHRKVTVQGSYLALPAIDEAGRALTATLQSAGIRAGDLKSVIIRTSGHGTVANLYVKRKPFPDCTLPEGLDGLDIIYSDPRSPASVNSGVLRTLGDTGLTDTLLGRTFRYDAASFFQVNMPVFEEALREIIKQADGQPAVDMYCGVGTIGLSLPAGRLTMVDIDPSNITYAEINAETRPETSIYTASTEQVLDEIAPKTLIILDPPRAGLHTKIVQQLTEVRPPKIVYLSCNPATQARDIAALQGRYRIEHFNSYNFFPRTPHIETLAILERK
jgi:23S rRNA (uracil1939-C5)-methyltransferase